MKDVVVDEAMKKICDYYRKGYCWIDFYFDNFLTTFYIEKIEKIEKIDNKNKK